MRAGCEIGMGFTFCRGKKREQWLQAMGGSRAAAVEDTTYGEREDGYQEKAWSLGSWYPMRLLKESAADCFLIRTVLRCSELEDST